MTRRPSSEKPHEHVDLDGLGVNDILSVDRTALANEQTLLAYIRTALTFAVSGGSAIQFLDGAVIDAIGYTFVAAGVLTGIIGALRFRTVRAQVQRIERCAPRSPRAGGDEREQEG